MLLVAVLPLPFPLPLPLPLPVLPELLNELLLETMNVEPCAVLVVSRRIQRLDVVPEVILGPPAPRIVRIHRDKQPTLARAEGLYGRQGRAVRGPRASQFPVHS